MKLSILIPCKREGASIAACLERTIKTYPQAEILVLDSGLDDTPQVVDSLKKRSAHLFYVPLQSDRGKGDAIAQGILKASGDILIQIDADLQFFPEELPRLVQPILENRADMTLGTRFSQTSQRASQSSSFLRGGGNFLISQWASYLVGQKITDALAGMKAWRREVTQSFSLTSVGFSYEVELFIKALRKGFRVMDVPVSYEARKTGQSKVSVLKTGLQILKDSVHFQYSSL